MGSSVTKSKRVYVSQADVLQVNHGHVCLMENNAQTEIYVRPMSVHLPLKSVQKTAFDDNEIYRAAKSRRQKYITFKSLSGNSILVVPTKPIANIRAFALYATPSEWTEFWDYVYKVRKVLEQHHGGKLYIETIGIDVPQLHIRLVRRSQRERV